MINDTGRAVQMVLDKAIVGHDPVNCHPLVNDMTTALESADLIRFLEAEGHPPLILDMDGLVKAD